jgi:hypothetical protein
MYTVQTRALHARNWSTVAPSCNVSMAFALLRYLGSFEAVRMVNDAGVQVVAIVPSGEWL